MTIEEKLEAELKIIVSEKYFFDFFRVKFIGDFLEEKNLNTLVIFQQFLDEKYPQLQNKYILGNQFTDPLSNPSLNAIMLLRPFVIEYFETKNLNTHLAKFDKFLQENTTDLAEVVFVRGVEIDKQYQKLEHIEFVKLFDVETIITKKNNYQRNFTYTYKGYFPSRVTSRYFRFKNNDPLKKIDPKNLPKLAIRYSDNVKKEVITDNRQSFTRGTINLKWGNISLLTYEFFEVLNLITNNCITLEGHYDDAMNNFAPIWESSERNSILHSNYNAQHHFKEDVIEKLNLEKLENTLNSYAKFKETHIKNGKSDKLMDLIKLVLRRFFAAKMEENPQDKLINFCICLEALLTNEGNSQEIALKFSLNGAWFLADRRDKEKTCKFLHDVYKMRSSVVHGGNPKKLNEIDFKELRAITAEIILKYLTLVKVPDFDKMRLGL